MQTIYTLSFLHLDTTENGEVNSVGIVQEETSTCKEEKKLVLINIKQCYEFKLCQNPGSHNHACSLFQLVLTTFLLRGRRRRAQFIFHFFLTSFVYLSPLDSCPYHNIIVELVSQHMDFIIHSFPALLCYRHCLSFPALFPSLRMLLSP